MKMKVYNICFNGHTWEQIQEVNPATGITDYDKCPECGASIQQQGIPELKC